jgi:hypothetical protein
MPLGSFFCLFFFILLKINWLFDTENTCSTEGEALAVATTSSSSSIVVVVVVAYFYSS